MFAGLNRGQTKTAPAAKADVAHKTKNTQNPNSIWQSLATNTTGLQAKLSVSQPGDRYELEADRVADRVMRMETPSSHADRLSFSAFNASAAQRKCDGCDEEEKQVQRKENGVGSNPVDAAASSVSHTLSSAGQPLDSSSRSFFEPRFAHDFGGVRIHTGTKASESARALNAQAYTVGQNIVFGAGQYVPSTQSGRHLLAHELSHVCQQTNPTAPLSRVTNTVQRQTGDPFTDPFGEGKKEEKKEPELDPATTRARAVCKELQCKKFPAIEIVPDVFVTMCDDSILRGKPSVNPVGCTPGHQGKIEFRAGTWQVKVPAKGCNFEICTGPNAKPGSTTGIQLGYIQTVQECLSGGVYFNKNKAGKWEWAGNKWCCVKNARDGVDGSVAPWYGAKGSFGPQPFNACPLFTDTPNIEVDARQGGNPLRRLRFDGIFHLWLVAKPPKKPLVFIHHWKIRCWVVAELAADDADPCNASQWYIMNMTEITGESGKGSATPVLTGEPANKIAQDCSGIGAKGYEEGNKKRTLCNPPKPKNSP